VNGDKTLDSGLSEIASTGALKNVVEDSTR
jgi:hypothetical protein